MAVVISNVVAALVCVCVCVCVCARGERKSRVIDVCVYREQHHRDIVGAINSFAYRTCVFMRRSILVFILADQEF